MKLINKVKLFYTDFLFQSTVFYIAFISSIGVLPYYMAGSGGTNSLLWDELYYLKQYFSISYLLKTLLNIFVRMPLFSILYSAPLSIANIYILKINTYKFDEQYLPAKLLFMLIAGFLLVPYLLIVAQGNYHVVLYSAFPSILTSTLYLLLIVYKQHK